MSNSPQSGRTSAEKIFAKALKLKKIDFIQNIYFGNYEIDFFLPEFKIVIEIDGYSHLSSIKQQTDLQKDSYLVERGFTVFRFTNHQVYTELNSCLLLIKNFIKALSPSAVVSINSEWKNVLRNFSPSNPKKQTKKVKTIEEYFLSLNEE